MVASGAQVHAAPAFTFLPVWRGFGRAAFAVFGGEPLETRAGHGWPGVALFRSLPRRTASLCLSSRWIAHAALRAHCSGAGGKEHSVADFRLPAVRTARRGQLLPLPAAL